MNFFDLVGYAGILLMSFGAWLVYPPAGFILGGALLFLLAILAANKVTPEKVKKNK